ncbi:MAG: hypothetical protein HRU19_22065 [Pseudobacteriovorax sp.]|nr:hypothetical protein [Pseudobacteriovorax sp.]
MLWKYLSIIALLLISSNSLAKSSFGPFKLRYIVVTENAPRKNITKQATIVAESSTNGSRYGAELKKGTIELPPGSYVLRGSADNCRIKPRIVDIFKHKKIVIRAVCL